jgi:hypothetical protein
MSRRLHIAGSAHPADADLPLLRDAHAVVRHLAYGWARRGGGLVAGLGAEPRHVADADLSVVFDGTVLLAARDALADGVATARTSEGALLALRTSRSQYDLAPEHVAEALAQLTEAGAVDLELLPDTWRSGALMRRAQAELGGVLVTFGGGAGVEDLINLYRGRRFPVVPIEIDIGASHSDGALGGGLGMARQALAHPSRFIEMADRSSPAARLVQLVMNKRRCKPRDIAVRLLTLLEDLKAPHAFCVRLLNRTHGDFVAVQWFFEQVAHPVLEAEGLCVIDLKESQQEYAWMQDEIFSQLHYAHTVLADLTGARPNCFIELGYALGRAHRVIVTAQDGERPPFDVDKLPWHFWQPGDAAAQRAALERHIEQYGGRPPLIEPAKLV